MKYINMIKKIANECKNRDSCRKCPLYIIDNEQNKARCILKDYGKHPENMMDNITLLVEG
jgi:hypothetical protein